MPSDFSSSPLSAFNPNDFGFAGPWPTERWGVAQLQYAKAQMLISGMALKAKDPRTRDPLYPLEIDLYDFVCETHATMVVGDGGNMPPITLFTGATKRAQKRAIKFTEYIAEAWRNSDPSLMWTLFYNTNVYGGYGLMARIQKGRGGIPIMYEPIPPMEFYPILDSRNNVIEFFIHRRITHSEARWIYGVTIPDHEVPYYTEYWNPRRYEVRINNRTAYYSDGNKMKGENIFGVAPAVYIPHLRKSSEWGQSQLLGIDALIKEFNARVADVSDSVRDGATFEAWGYNVAAPEQIYFGRRKVYALGENLDSRRAPHIETMSSGSTIKDGAAFADWMWDMILYLSRIPLVALGVDEGSQRSSMTLRSRFWPLVAHSTVERTYAERGLNELARITILGLHALGIASSNGNDTSISQTWPDMLPQDRLELLNEMVQRRSAGLISQLRAMQQFGDIPDPIEEQEIIRAEEQIIQGGKENDGKADQDNGNAE